MRVNRAERRNHQRRSGFDRRSGEDRRKFDRGTSDRRQGERRKETRREEDVVEERKFDDQIEGRNSVLELLESGKDINKIFVTRGEKHGSINKILAIAKEKKITSGPVFVTKTGKPLDRSTIWKMMKALCESARVSKNKVFPHNLRHLFARTFYTLQKDIVRLADILGHSSVNTTRIYTMETGEIHRRQIQKLGLLQI